MNKQMFPKVDRFLLLEIESRLISMRENKYECQKSILCTPELFDSLSQDIYEIDLIIDFLRGVM